MEARGMISQPIPADRSLVNSTSNQLEIKVDPVIPEVSKDVRKWGITIDQLGQAGINRAFNGSVNP